MMAVNHEVIQEYLHKCENEVVENLRDYALKCGMARFQPEHHDYCYEHSPFHDEGRFLLIVQVHADLIIAVEPVLNPSRKL